MITGDRNTLSLLGEQAKVTTPDRLLKARLSTYLRGLPSQGFSEKGRANVCRCFGVTDKELVMAAAALQPRPSAPTPELLRTIGEAVGRYNARGGAKSC